MTLKAEKLVAEEKQFDKQQKEIAKLEDFVQKILSGLQLQNVLRRDVSNWKK